MSVNHRIHALDSARACMMLLGILFHASLVYSVDKNWLVIDSQPHQAFNWLGAMLHIFRMAAFFWIAGFFTAIAFERSHDENALKIRLLRLGVPLASVWILFNPIQILISAWHKGLSGSDTIGQGVGVEHLWFLQDLLLLTLLAWLWRKCMPRIQKIPEKLLGHLGNWTIPGCALFATAMEMIVRATPIAYSAWPTGFTLYSLTTYAPYFMVGYWMREATTAQRAFLTTNPLTFIPFAVIALSASKGQHPELTGSAEELRRFFELLGQWGCVAAVLSIFYRWFNHNTPATQALSNASYSVYLVHQPILVVLSALLASSTIHAGWKYTLVCLSTALLSLAFHHVVVERSIWCKFLFNGIRPSSAGRSSSARD